MKDDSTFNAIFNDNESLNADFSEVKQFNANFNEVIVVKPKKYTGEYNVIPKREEQKLETKDTFLEENVTVEEIPYAETSNPYGTTISIAS